MYINAQWNMTTRPCLQTLNQSETYFILMIAKDQKRKCVWNVSSIHIQSSKCIKDTT